MKLVTKEDVDARRGPRRLVHFLAPVARGDPGADGARGHPVRARRSASLGDVSTPLYVTDVNVGLLFLLAITSIGVYGIILGGWASNNKYSLLGGLRSAAQLVSYEVPMGLALVAVLLMTRSLSLVEIVEAQERIAPLVRLPGPPLLLPLLRLRRRRDEPQPVRPAGGRSRSSSPGFNTEYSGVKFAFFFLGEYTAMIIISCVAVTRLLRRLAARRSRTSRRSRSWTSCRRSLWFLLKVGVLPLRLHLVPRRRSRGTGSTSSWRSAGSG